MDILRYICELVVTFFFAYGIFAFRDDLLAANKNRRMVRRLNNACKKNNRQDVN